MSRSPWTSSSKDRSVYLHFHSLFLSQKQSLGAIHRLSALYAHKPLILKIGWANLRVLLFLILGRMCRLPPQVFMLTTLTLTNVFHIWGCEWEMICWDICDLCLVLESTKGVWDSITFCYIFFPMSPQPWVPKPDKMPTGTLLPIYSTLLMTAVSIRGQQTPKLSLSWITAPAFSLLQQIQTML